MENDLKNKLKTKFYNLRNRIDKKKDYTQAVGELSVQVYLNILPDIENKRILDAGFGNGWLIKYLICKSPKKVYGVDLSSERVEEIDDYLSKTSMDYDVRCGSIDCLDFIESSSLDFINCRDVIEHLPSPDCAMSEFRRVLKKGGVLLMQTPNALVHRKLELADKFFSLLESLRGVNNKGLEAGPFLMNDAESLNSSDKESIEEFNEQDIQEHEKLFYPNEFLSILESNGFRIEKLSGTPLFSAVFFQLGSMFPKITEMYVDLVSSEGYPEVLSAIKSDLLLHGRIAEGDVSLPINYILSDDIIVMCRKK